MLAFLEIFNIEYLQCRVTVHVPFKPVHDETGQQVLNVPLGLQLPTGHTEYGHSDTHDLKQSPANNVDLW